MINRIIISIIIFAQAFSHADNLYIPEIEAHYNFYYKNVKAGTMILKVKNKNNKIIASTIYNGNVLANLAGRGYREEISYLNLKDNKLYAEKYIFKDTKDNYEIIFNRNHAKVIKKDSSFDLKASSEIYDPIAMMLVLMFQFSEAQQSYNVVSKKNLKIYDYIYKKNFSMLVNNKKYTGYSAEYINDYKHNFFFFSEDHKNLLVYNSIKKNEKENLRIELIDIKKLN